MTRHRSRWWLAAALASAALLLGACGSDEAAPAATPAATAAATAAPDVTATPAPPAFPVTITDSSGTEITIEAAPLRIVSHSPALTEILFAIGAGPQVVAVDNFSNYPPEVLAMQHVRYSSPEPEQAVALDADIIFFSGRQRGSVEAFRALDLPIFLNEEPTTLAGVLESITLIGRITGHQEEAAALVAEMQTRIDAVTAKVADVTEGPLVFWEITDGLYTVGPESFIGSMLTLLKARNVAADATTAFPQLTAEAIVERDPNVIFFADADAGVTVAAIGERPGWGDIAAVRDARVFEVHPDVASRPGPRIVEALEMVAQALYPDRFP
ncbi:MAG: ABC transporter substrate-binding protein [Chloroflexi bacterium]|nr:ABC transporter substrate-binding protein [Chloroflexota bacterium]